MTIEVFGRKRKRTKVVRVPTRVLDGLQRVMPDPEMSDYDRFTVLWTYSAINLEDALGGRKKKQNVRKKR